MTARAAEMRTSIPQIASVIRHNRIFGIVPLCYKQFFKKDLMYTVLPMLIFFFSVLTPHTMHNLHQTKEVQTYFIKIVHCQT